MRTISKYIHRLALLIALFAICGEVVGQKQEPISPAKRKALVGPDCMINSFGQNLSIGLLQSYENMGAITNEDLTDYATIGGISVDVIEKPLLGIKDTKNIYKAGTQAGFCLVTSSTKLLSLSLADVFAIKVKGIDGKEQLIKVEQNSATGIGLDLISVGSDAVSVEVTVTPDIDFNEITLYTWGIEATVGLGSMGLGIKYAFVGKVNEIRLTHADLGKISNSIDLDRCESFPWPVTHSWREDNLNDVILNNNSEDYEDYLFTVPIVPLPFPIDWFDIKIAVKHQFKAGTEVGFKYSGASLLNLVVGPYTQIELYQKGKEDPVQTETIASLASLSVGEGEDSKISIISEYPFDEVRFKMGGALAVDLGQVCVYYGYIREQPEVNHHCEINPSLSATLCDGEKSYQLTSDIPVTWEVVRPTETDGIDIPLFPSGSEGTVVNVTGLNEDNYDYMFRATASDGCSEIVTLHKGVDGGGASCGRPVVNAAGETKYAISDQKYETSGSLLSISDMINAEAVVDNDVDNNYATYTGGLSVANDLGIIGVKTTDGSHFEDLVPTDKSRRVGFIVEDRSTLLSANVLQFYQIRLYNNGKRVEDVPLVIDESNIVGVGLIGNEQAQKVRYSIEVPAGKEFDEFQLWKSGAIDLDLSTLRIYYGFIEDADENCSDPLSSSCADAISTSADDMHITVTPYMPFSLASVAVVVTDIANLVDDDYTTAMKVVQTVNAASKIAFSIKLGRVIDDRQQVGLVTDNITYLAGIEALSQLSIETYRKGSPTGEQFSNWSTVGLNLIGFGDKNYLIASPTLPYDEIRVTIGGLASVLDGINFYGLFFRSDIDGDGLPDCLDTTPCPGELSGLAVTKDLCQGDFLHLTGLGSLDAGDKEDTYAVYLVYPAAVTSSNPKDDVLLGEIKITSENLLIDENYQISVEPDEEYSIKLVRTNLTAGEEERTYDVGMTFTVHPREATWKGGTSGKENDWNEWGNWEGGSPWSCTNVIIPTNGDKNQPIENYPILTKDVQNPCNYIHFEPHAEVVNTPYLTYQKAWVEIALQPDRYYMVSAPLKNIYSGDWFYPRVTMDASTSGTDAQTAIEKVMEQTPYFTALTEQTMPANRVTPTIYQRVWERTVVNKLASGGQAGVYPTYAGTSWTAPYNWLSTSYEKQEKTNYASNALSVWVHPFSATDEDEEKPAPTGNDKKLFYTFRFPKEHTTYFYTNEKGEPLSYSANLTREHVGRFIYEDEESNASFPIKMVYKNEGNDADNKFFLVGNPFMSHINVAEFFDGNPSITSIKVYDGDAYNSIIDLKKDEGLLSATRDENDVDDISSIAPMQSFFVETDGTSDLPEICEITYTEDMLEQNPNPDKEDGYLKSAHAATDEDRIYLTALAAGKESSAVLRFSASASDYFRSGEDADILIDDEVPPAVAVFTVAGERAVDIQQRVNGGEIPLGFYLSKPEEVTLRLAVPRAYEGWLLNDAETGKSYPLRAGTNEFPLGRMLTNVGRFSLHGDSPTGNETITASQPRVYCFREEGNMLVVRSEAGMMARCEVYAPSGQLSGMARYETNEYRLPVAPGAKIVRVYFTDGVTSTIKTF